MPPKSQVGTAPVYDMTHEAQVQLLSDALLREYMHRKGFKKTLSTFDKEHPRDENTISSRAVMADLMALLPVDQQRLKQEGVETIMEMLCDLRVEKRQEVEALEEKASADVPDVPQECLSIIAKQNQKALGKKDKALAKQQRAEKNAKKRLGTASIPSAGLRSGIFLEKEMTLDDLLESDSDHETSTKPARQSNSSFLMEKGKKASLSSSNFTAPVPQGGSEKSSPLLQDDGRKEKVGSGYEKVREGSSPCPGEQLREAYKVLCGNAPSPPRSFLQQGIFFDDAVGFRLIQWEKGPGAAIAGIQAFISAFYFERSFVESQEHQQHTRVRALAHILLTAQPDPSQIVFVDGLLSLTQPTAEFHKQFDAQFACWKSFRSAREVEECLTALVREHWGGGKSCGLWCFLVSLVLSRGAGKVKLDCNAAPLIDRDGNGTLPLANLCLCGVACSASSVEEYKKIHLQCGLLLSDVEPQGMSYSEDFPPVGTPANPVLPSWVVRRNEHYCNLFMKKDARKVFEQKRGLGGSASVELTFWDALTEEDEFHLEVQVSGAAWGGRRRNVNSFLNNAILSVPPWNTGVIQWKEAYPPQ